MGERPIPGRVDFGALSAAELVRRLCAAERALTWYANPRNWGDDDWGVRSVAQGSEYGRPGTRARAALRTIRGVVRA